ncbi:hypothetical protein DW841_22480 [Hungatella hathewayi]|nr:hypothetical protein DW841_22480 [Hungatella hathewayi]
MKKSVNERVKEAMKEQGVDLLLITPSSDMVYLLGKCMMSDERLNVYVVPAEGRDFLFVNDVYGQEVAGWGIPETEVVTWKDGENAVSLLLEQLEKKRLPYGKIGIGASMPAGFLVPLQEAFARTRFVLHREILGRMRRYKNEQEQSLMEEACSRCTEALKAVMKAGSGWIGKTEGAFADALCREMEQRGISEAGALSVREPMRRCLIIREKMASFQQMRVFWWISEANTGDTVQICREPFISAERTIRDGSSRPCMESCWRRWRPDRVRPSWADGWRMLTTRRDV